MGECAPRPGPGRAVRGPVDARRGGRVRDRDHPDGAAAAGRATGCRGGARRAVRGGRGRYRRAAGGRGDADRVLGVGARPRLRRHRPARPRLHRSDGDVRPGTGTGRGELRHGRRPSDRHRRRHHRGRPGDRHYDLPSRRALDRACHVVRHDRADDVGGHRDHAACPARSAG